MKEKLKILVESMDHLKELCSQERMSEFYVRLNGGCRSSKRIRYYPEDEQFIVHHEIDDSWDELITEEELHELTNIPEAIEKGALFYEGC